MLTVLGGLAEFERDLIRTRTGLPMHRIDVYRMIRRRAADMSLQTKIGCHAFRATGITAYLEAGGTLENAQAMAAHESPRTTKLYDRTADVIHAR
jgi:integrase/recombinase XerD